MLIRVMSLFLAALHLCLLAPVLLAKRALLVGPIKQRKKAYKKLKCELDTCVDEDRREELLIAMQMHRQSFEGARQKKEAAVKHFAEIVEGQKQKLNRFLTASNKKALADTIFSQRLKVFTSEKFLWLANRDQALYDLD